MVDVALGFALASFLWFWFLIGIVAKTNNQIQRLGRYNGVLEERLRSLRDIMAGLQSDRDFTLLRGGK